MTKGSLVLFEVTDKDGQLESVPGIIIKGPYGCMLPADTPPVTVYETKVADVLFGSRLVRKIPIMSLRTVK
jgi:hypothetical protein